MSDSSNRIINDEQEQCKSRRTIVGYDGKKGEYQKKVKRHCDRLGN
jgi:hypothetical protein